MHLIALREIIRDVDVAGAIRPVILQHHISLEDTVAHTAHAKVAVKREDRPQLVGRSNAKDKPACGGCLIFR